MTVPAGFRIKGSAREINGQLVEMHCPEYEIEIDDIGRCPGPGWIEALQSEGPF